MFRASFFLVMCVLLGLTAAASHKLSPIVHELPVLDPLTAEVEKVHLGIKHDTFKASKDPLNKVLDPAVVSVPIPQSASTTAVGENSDERNKIVTDSGGISLDVNKTEILERSMLHKDRGIEPPKAPSPDSIDVKEEGSKASTVGHIGKTDVAHNASTKDISETPKTQDRSSVVGGLGVLADGETPEQAQEEIEERPVFSGDGDEGEGSGDVSANSLDASHDKDAVTSTASTTRRPLPVSQFRAWQQRKQRRRELYKRIRQRRREMYKRILQRRRELYKLIIAAMT